MIRIMMIIIIMIIIIIIMVNDMYEVILILEKLSLTEKTVECIFKKTSFSLCCIVYVAVCVVYSPLLRGTVQAWHLCTLRRAERS